MSSARVGLKHTDGLSGERGFWEQELGWVRAGSLSSRGPGFDSVWAGAEGERTNNHDDHSNSNTWISVLTVH